MGCSLYLNHSFFGPLKFLFVVLDFACLVNVFVGSISFVQCVPIFVACVSCFEIYWIIFTSLASFAGYIMFVDTTELLTVCFHAVDSNAVLLLHGAGGTCKNVSESANPLYPADNGGHRGPFLHRCDGLASCCERIEFRLLGSRARLFPCQGAFLRWRDFPDSLMNGIMRVCALCIVWVHCTGASAYALVERILLHVFTPCGISFVSFRGMPNVRAGRAKRHGPASHPCFQLPIRDLRHKNVCHNELCMSSKQTAV